MARLRRERRSDRAKIESSFDLNQIPHPAFGIWRIRAVAVASRADEYRQRAQECLEMAGTFRDRKARVALSHMAEVWLRLADNGQERSAVQQQQQIQPNTDDKA